MQAAIYVPKQLMDDQHELSLLILDLLLLLLLRLSRAQEPGDPRLLVCRRWLKGDPPYPQHGDPPDPPTH